MTRGGRPVEGHRKGEAIDGELVVADYVLAVAAFADVFVDPACTGGIEDAECVRLEVFADIVTGQNDRSTSPCWSSSRRSFCSPSRILVFTVPSGWCSPSAISCCV